MKTSRTLRIFAPLCAILAFPVIVSSQAAATTIARDWNERALASIRVDTPHPPAQARNLFSLSVCMYDAWAAYDPTAVGFIYHGKHTAADVDAARREAISYAAYRMLIERHVYSRTATNTLPLDHAFMASLGYDTNNISRDLSTPAGLGNAIYDAVSSYFINDGSRQTAGTPFPTANPPIGYPDYPTPAEGRYVFTNPPMNPFLHGISDGTNHTIIDVNHWQRLIVANSVDQNGFPQNPLQGYLGAQWLGVRAFSLVRADIAKPWIDPGPPPFFGGPRDAEFKDNLVEVIRRSSQLTVDDGVTVDISPASQGDNTLGANDGHGYTTNPVTGLPYTPNVVLRGDFARGLTEFWADGPTSETPPGHWNVIANNVSDNPLTVKRIGAAGPVVSDLEWDVKLYFALNASLHDAACAAWSIKRFYDAWRPIGAIRYCGGLGQSSEPALPSYNVGGLPLVPGLIELVTTDSVASGHHDGLTPGKIAVLSWPGQPADPSTDVSGVRWVHAEDWITYQKKTFVTPGFPGYISGHSTFSRSAAEVMTAFTGSKWFPGGMGSFTISKLVNEFGPTAPVTLQWASYYDAADQVGVSRIWGGIHPPVDDFAGRRVGAEVGKDTWELAKLYFDGSITNSTVTVAARSLGDGSHEVRFNTRRGLYYKLQSTTDLNAPFADEAGAASLALEGWVARTNSTAGAAKFYRGKTTLAP